MPRAIRLTLFAALVWPAVLGLLAPRASAEVRLPAIFGTNMVLQRDMPVPVWGWASPGEEIKVSVAGQSKSVTTPESGKWMLRLDPLTTGGPLTMTVTGKNTLKLDNVLVGEVWLCSGQSNMVMQMTRINHADKEIAAARYPRIRLISVPRHTSQEPREDFEGHWVECTPATVKDFSAAGYFFGRTLYQQLDVPIGLVNSSCGSSSCETWMERSVLQRIPQCKPLLEEWDEIARTYDYEKAWAAYEKELATWNEAAAAAKAAGKTPPEKPERAWDWLHGTERPANLYNSMVAPLIPLAIRGVIWYQGENNERRGYQYRSMFPALIESWRKNWHEGDFPFYFVQLPNIRRRTVEPGESYWAELRKAQAMALKLPNTGMAVTIDVGGVGEPDEMHPMDKQDVGKRLALWALAKNYGKDVVYSGPLYRSMRKDGDKIVLSFADVDGGLVAKGGKLVGFAVAGADRKFASADARIEGATVVVSSPKVPDPVAVRYAWAENPPCNLYNRGGLPASPFRTDDWPGLSAGKFRAEILPRK